METTVAPEEKSAHNNKTGVNEPAAVKHTPMMQRCLDIDLQRDLSINSKTYTFTYTKLTGRRVFQVFLGGRKYTNIPKGGIDKTDRSPSRSMLRSFMRQGTRI
jgi:hypothetical protein